MSHSQIIIYSLVGGIIPALIWLFFWLREDAKRPEPKGRLAETFLLGMLAVILVLPLQKLVAMKFTDLDATAFSLWALIEEVFKFLAAYALALRSKDNDEPVDSIIYMLTAALGFVALENALFILNPLLQQDIGMAISTGGTRFLGASLLHVLSSGSVGVAMALAFYKSRAKQLLYLLVGIILAVVIHTSFNLFILNGDNLSTLETFALVWVGIAILLGFFERVKAIARSV